ncbi:unnamed protein product [Cylicostephanus goldi]|uniref:Uncharacterized protein n=1 Tax=Cylicostephanus goldi TaxID=71465 RepID=A0A3P7MQV1_CYLGO|nr:unnamed protein product [Cylicostephanus goldi]
MPLNLMKAHLLLYHLHLHLQIHPSSLLHQRKANHSLYLLSRQYLLPNRSCAMLLLRAHHLQLHLLHLLAF